ncbi:MAG TPA: VOC family protein, partial [Phenylobacterium sp.]|nr:VOC family protein [Phenylobacterium sp.]
MRPYGRDSAERVCRRLAFESLWRSSCQEASMRYLHTMVRVRDLEASLDF